MSRDGKKLIGFIIGREKEMPDAVMSIINDQYGDEAHAELVKIGGTFQGDTVPYDVIIDRMSHEIPYYRIYAKYACLNGCYLINNPFTWAADTKFFGANLAQKLGLKTPRTMVLPNKDVDTDTVPDSFRNLEYPMDWEGIIAYIGGQGIFKDVRSGGRRFAHRVNSVDELIQRYDESGTRTMILQTVMETGDHVHCLVIGQEKTLLLPYSFADGKYYDGTLEPEGALGKEMAAAALQLTQIYDYDINMVEFVVIDGEPTVINVTNPSPLINHELMTATQFDWIVREIAQLALARAREPREQIMPVRLPASLMPRMQQG